MPSVWITPGETQTARIPNRDHSSAIPAAKVSRALRAIDDGTTLGIPRRGLNPRNAMNPLRCGIIQRSATRAVTSQVASTFRRWIARRPFGEVVLEAGRELTAGVVHQDVDPVGALRDRVEERADLLGLAHIARLREAPVAELARRPRRSARTGARRSPRFPRPPRSRGRSPRRSRCPRRSRSPRGRRARRVRAVSGTPLPWREYAGGTGHRGRRCPARHANLPRAARRADGGAAPRARVEPAHLGPDGARAPASTRPSSRSTRAGTA